MLRSLFNEFWLYLGGTVSVKRNDPAKRRGPEILSSGNQAL